MNSMKLIFTLLGLFVMQLFGSQKPNIVVIMTDDMGFSDIGLYGSEIETPNLDHLAQEGLRFTQFYNTGHCCPTRASLLTGLYAHQAGMGGMTGDEKKPGYRGRLMPHSVTIAEVLKADGYATIQTGKPWALYNMEKDRSELNNLVSSIPEKVQELKGLYEAWSKRCVVKR